MKHKGDFLKWGPKGQVDIIPTVLMKFSGEYTLCGQDSEDYFDRVNKWGRLFNLFFYCKKGYAILIEREKCYVYSNK